MKKYPSGVVSNGSPAYVFKLDLVYAVLFAICRYVWKANTRQIAMAILRKEVGKYESDD
jgi:hypothetical protein